MHTSHPRTYRIVTTRCNELKVFVLDRIFGAFRCVLNDAGPAVLRAWLLRALLGYHYDDSTVTRTTASPLYYSILLDGAQSAKSESLSQTERVDKDRIVPM